MDSPPLVFTGGFLFNPFLIGGADREPQLRRVIDKEIKDKSLAILSGAFRFVNSFLFLLVDVCFCFNIAP